MKDSVSILLLTNNSKIILQHRDNIGGIEHPGYWGLIGGWIEESESPLSAIRREVAEELYSLDGSTIEIKDLKLMLSDYRNDKGWIEYVFTGKLTNHFEILGIREGQNMSEFPLESSVFLLKIAMHHKSYIKNYFIKTNIKFTDMTRIEDYLELNQLGSVKDYKALEVGDGYILPDECNPTGVFHTKEDAKVVALLVFKKDVPRGFHYHIEKIEYMTVLSGKLKCEFSLPDRDEKLEIVLLEGQQIRVSPGCIHTYTALEKNVYAIEYAPHRYKESDVIIVK